MLLVLLLQERYIKNSLKIGWFDKIKPKRYIKGISLFYFSMTPIGGSVFTQKEVTEILQLILKGFDNLATKDDIYRLENRVTTLENKFDVLESRIGVVEESIKGMEYRIMDHVTREFAKSRGETVVLVRKEDENVDEVVSVIEKKGVINTEEAHELHSMGPFPRITL